MYKIKEDPHGLPPGFGYDWTDAMAMKMVYICTSRVLLTLSQLICHLVHYENELWQLNWHCPHYSISAEILKGGCHYLGSSDILCFSIWGNAHQNGWGDVRYLVRGGLFPQSILTWYLLGHTQNTNKNAENGSGALMGEILKLGWLLSITSAHFPIILNQSQKFS